MTKSQTFSITSLARSVNDIINKVKGVNRVTYDISSKPPATIGKKKFTVPAEEGAKVVWERDSTPVKNVTCVKELFNCIALMSVTSFVGLEKIFLILHLKMRKVFLLDWKTGYCFYRYACHSGLADVFTEIS